VKAWAPLLTVVGATAALAASPPSLRQPELGEREREHAAAAADAAAPTPTTTADDDGGAPPPTATVTDEDVDTLRVSVNAWRCFVAAPSLCAHSLQPRNRSHAHTHTT